MRSAPSQPYQYPVPLLPLSVLDAGIRDEECTVPVSRPPVPIVPVSRTVPYVPAPTQPKAALLLDIACSFDETAFMHGMAAATSAFVDDVDSLEDFAPPEVHAAIVLIHSSTPVPVTGTKRARRQSRKAPRPLVSWRPTIQSDIN
jgi:hypothetical protein